MFKVFFSNAVNFTVLMYKDRFSEFKIPEGYEIECIIMDCEIIDDENCYVFTIKGKTSLYNQDLKVSSKILPKLNKDKHPVLKKNITSYQNLIKNTIQKSINITKEDIQFLESFKNNFLKDKDFDIKNINTILLGVLDSSKIKKKLKYIIKNSYLTQKELKDKFLTNGKE